MNDQTDLPDIVPVDMSAFGITPPDFSANAFDNITPDNTVLALFPPRIPGATEPVEGAHLGVSLRIYDLTPMGLRVDVDPYLDQAPGDTVSINLNGQTAIVSTQTDTASSITTLYIPKKMLLAGIVNRLTYTITRGSQNMGTSEPPLEMLYNAVRPGNVDRFPNVEGHSELELILPDAIKNGVGPDFVSAQVCVSYPYCRAYDVIWLNCNGYPVYHTVTPGEAPAPPDPGSDTPTHVCFTVTRADLEQARDNPQFNFSYTVTDQLGNNPDPNNPWSASHIVDVDLGGNRLPAPILREILDDANDDPNTIDLEKLGSNDLSVVILTGDGRFQKGDSIAITYIATLPGQPDVVVQVTGVVETDPFGQKKPCILLVPNDKVLANSVVRVSYQLIRNGVIIATSRTANARVIGEGLPNLLPPSLIKSANGVLDPLDPANLQGATGRVEVLGYRPGDTVQLIVVGAPGAGSPTFQPKPLNTNSQADFQLDKAFIAANMGKVVTLRYVLFRNGTPYDSQELTVSIGKIPDSHPSLPIPAIDGATGNALDVTKLQASDLLRVSEWPHQATGQPVWSSYEGIDANGTAVTFEDRKGEPHTTLPGFSSPVPLAWLKSLKNGSVLKITFRVNFDGVSNSATATSFPVRTYIVSQHLEIDQTTMVLNGLKLVQSYGWASKEVTGNTATRLPQGGVPPYIFASTDPSVATVDAGGKVSGIKNGGATIQVTDAAGASVSYPVSVSRVYRMLINNTLMYARDALAWGQAQGVSIYDGEPYSAIANNFSNIQQLFAQAGPTGRRWQCGMYQYSNGQIVIYSLWYDPTYGLTGSGLGYPQVGDRLLQSAFCAVLT
ncbi:Ig-like domain-containing protein [Pseudomonas sp. 6D_7.1_Bac1]|uniref:Ig-like domain-containing protein n=1 Tax=Pseudomonas sp. 6D_7.1_Bac1 TaxID=2971615 RepID=UPI0021CA8C86|nr:Ig-like domain-containing protein [Pseudomonas sp. 6D_7.1_Bac1]MCU1752440.1 Ig-like domain-containing protein [Pseudomonas sp. 6D_7.1_Bac1]